MDGFEAALLHNDSDVAFFSEVPLFRDVPAYELQHIVAMTRRQRFAAGEVILREGDTTNDLLFVGGGTVEVYVSRQDQKISITTLGPASYFGEMSVFDDYPRSANVAAVTGVVAFRIDRDNFRAFLKTHPAALYQMCTVFSHRLRSTNTALAKH